MQIGVAYKIKVGSILHKKHSWGNKTVDELVKEFPKLKALVDQLKKQSWHIGGHPKNHAWSVLFHINYATKTPIIGLEIKTNTEKVEVHTIKNIDPNNPPTLPQIKDHVLKHMYLT